MHVCVADDLYVNTESYSEELSMQTIKTVNNKDRSIYDFCVSNLIWRSFCTDLLMASYQKYPMENDKQNQSI